jgi:exonuclease I
MLTSTHLFTNLFTWPWIFSTGNAKQIDSLPILQNYDFYAPNTIAVELNEKSNKSFKLGSLCRMNGFDLGDKAHTADADTLGMSKLMELINNKNPELFQKCISLNDKKNVLSAIKDVDYFCHPETFFGRTRQFTSSYLCEHPVYKGYHLVFDLKHDPETMFGEKSNSVLKKTLNSAPKKYRTLKIGKNPFIQDKSFATNFNDEYKTLGHDILKTRADFIFKNRDELASRLSLIISDQFQEQAMDQTEPLPEEMIFSLKPSPSDKALMDHYVIANTLEEQRKIHDKFKGPIKHLSEMILLDRFDKEAFSTEEYKRVRKGISRRLLSTSKEVFPTIPDGMARIDQLREEKKDESETLQKVERINKHLEGLAKDHEKYL